MFGRRLRVGLSVNILDAADTVGCEKCIAMTLNVHRDLLFLSAFLVGNLRVRAGVAIRSAQCPGAPFVENTPW